MTELQRYNPNQIQRHEAPNANAVLAAWVQSLDPDTQRSYNCTLRTFAAFLGMDDAADALRHLLSLEAGAANYLALQFKTALQSAGQSNSTINNRLSALRSIVTACSTVGLVNWTLKVRCEKKRHKKMKGPTRDEMAAIFEVVKDNPRDACVIALLYYCALRRDELASLRLEDIDFSAKSISIRSKGGDIDTLPIENEIVIRNLAAWVRTRGQHSGPLIGLTSSGIYKLVKRIGKRLGLTARPHGLRHSVLTTLLDETGDARSVMALSRHKRVQTLIDHYDDSDKMQTARMMQRKLGGDNAT